MYGSINQHRENIRRRRRKGGDERHGDCEGGALRQTPEIQEVYAQIGEVPCARPGQHRGGGAEGSHQGNPTDFEAEAFHLR